MPFTRPLLMIAIASLVSACAVGPDYHRPPTPLPERYLGQAALDQRHADLGADLGADFGADRGTNLLVWWERFGDPQLTRCVQRALAQNLDLTQASARVAQARAGIGAANAALLPAGSVQAQAARAYQSVETPLGQVMNSQPNFDRYGNAYEAGLGVGWELDLFGGLRRGREAALADYQASTAGAAAARLAVAAQTADIYIGIRGLQTRLALARKQVDTQSQLLATVNLLYGKGLAAELQVRQAEGALAQVRASVPVLETGLETAMNALDVMLGTVPGSQRAALAEAGAIPAAPRIVAAGTPGDLLRRRPDLIVAERRLAASNARIGVAVAEYYPKLSLSGLIGSATSDGAGNLFSGGASQASGALGLRWRLFDFGRINAQIEVAKGQEAEAVAAYRLAVLRAAEDVENAMSALVKREEQAGILTQGVDALTRARGASLAAYQKGVLSLVEVLQADENVLRAADTRAQAQTESARAAVAAFRALGGGWDGGHADALAVK
ncbi:MAG: efflux transporter outer membrane subunit [Massilia sp.]